MGNILHSNRNDVKMLFSRLIFKELSLKASELFTKDVLSDKDNFNHPQIFLNPSQPKPIS